MRVYFERTGKWDCESKKLILIILYHYEAGVPTVLINIVICNIILISQE